MAKAYDVHELRLGYRYTRRGRRVPYAEARRIAKAVSANRKATATSADLRLGLVTNDGVASAIAINGKFLTAPDFKGLNDTSLQKSLRDLFTTAHALRPRARAGQR